MYIYIHTYIYIYIYRRRSGYIYIYIYTHTHTHTHTPAPFRLQEEEGLLPRGHAEAVAWLHASRLLEASARSLFGADNSGAFLTAMGAGADASWPKGTRPRDVADRLRAELAGVLGGGAAVRALLAAMTRDGRLHPGLAPPVEGPVVSGEMGRGEFKVTPPEELARMLEEAVREEGGAAG